MGGPRYFHKEANSSRFLALDTAGLLPLCVLPRGVVPHVLGLYAPKEHASWLIAGVLGNELAFDRRA
jgi:hypothetical protein